MKKIGLVVLAIFGVIALMCVMVFGTVSGTYNKLIIQRNNVESMYSTVEVMMQRRLDLIPNLVSSVQGFMDHESETYKAVAAFREGLTPYVNEDSNGNLKVKEGLSQEEMSQFSNQLLSFRVEAYPELKEGMMSDLMVNLEGSENRISVARRDYNLSVETYKNMKETFPNNIIIGMFSSEFKDYDMFKASEAAKDTPIVEFK